MTAFFASLLVPTASLPSLALVTALFFSFELITEPGARSWALIPLFLILPEVTAWVLIFAFVTAWEAMLTALTWPVPSLVAATALALRATKRAMTDRTLATVRCRLNVFTRWDSLSGPACAGRLGMTWKLMSGRFR